MLIFLLSSSYKDSTRKHFPCLEMDRTWQVAKIFGQCKSFEDLNYSTDPKTGCTCLAKDALSVHVGWFHCTEDIRLGALFIYKKHDNHDTLRITSKVFRINSMEFVSLAVLSLRICRTNVHIAFFEVEEKSHVRWFLCEHVGYTAAATQ